MKGMIFNELFEMIDEVFSLETTEKIIKKANLSNHGAYTDVGTYDHQEIIRLIAALSAETGISEIQLQYAYGKYLFQKLWKRYGDVVEPIQDVLTLLKTVDNHIHVEVLKLYPDAEFPKFECTSLENNKMQMIYRSNHPFWHLAEGLMQGAALHYNQKIHIERFMLPASVEKKFNVQFIITREP